MFQAASEEMSQEGSFTKVTLNGHKKSTINDDRSWPFEMMTRTRDRGQGKEMRKGHNCERPKDRGARSVEQANE